jgi:hypothetical protein
MTYNNGKEFADHAVVDDALKSTMTADELKMIQDCFNHRVLQINSQPLN